MNRKKKIQGMVLLVSIALICYLSVKVMRSIEKKEIQKVTGFAWPRGTKEMQWEHGSLQGSWVKVHLQLPDSIQLNTNKFSRFDFSYCGEFDPKTMNIYRWEKQHRIWRDQNENPWFDEMKTRPVLSTNLLFATYKPFEDVKWVIVYDEQLKQMWIHCF